MCLMVVLMLFFGLTHSACSFTLHILHLLIAAVSSHNSKPGNFINIANGLTQKIPLTMITVLSKMQHILDDDSLSIHATCPKCCSIYPIKGMGYQAVCTYRDTSRGEECGIDLFTQKGKPIRPFVLPDLYRYIARLISQAKLEEHIDQSSRKALTGAKQGISVHANDIFDASYIRQFKGPDGNRLFVDGGEKDEARLVFSLNVDWFNVFRSTMRGDSTSTGVIILACLNLPSHLRYRPENMFVSIIPGPQVPRDSQINHFLRPIVDSFEQLWYNGIRLSSTPRHSNGRLLRAAIGPVVCDLPAARKVAGLLSYSGKHQFCSVCNQLGSDGHGKADHPKAGEARLCGIALPMPKRSDTPLPSNRTLPEGDDQADTGPPGGDKWLPRPVHDLREQACAWRAADSLKAREALWWSNGVRWSELWRLPYWNPVEQLVVDPMHTLLEGVVQHHFRHVLRLSEEHRAPEQANAFDAKTEAGIDFSKVTWDSKSFGTVPNPDQKSRIEEQVIKILHLLSEPVTDTSAWGEKATNRISKFLKCSVYFVAKKVDKDNKEISPKMKVKDLSELVVRWVSYETHSGQDLIQIQRLNKPINPATFIPNNVDMLRHVRGVIDKTDVPSWIPSMPRDWGSAAMGTPKADEWRMMATIYFPIAVLSKWGGGVGTTREERGRRQLLDLTMCLVQATWLACGRSTDGARQSSYLTYLCTYLHNLQSTVSDSRFLPNHHFAIHIYDFLSLWGPVQSWWCFPFERTNGMLQRIDTSHVYGVFTLTLPNLMIVIRTFRRVGDNVGHRVPAKS
jgi:hypothetical protein